MQNVTVAIQRREGEPISTWVLHMIEACPDRLALAPEAFDLLEVGPVELNILKARHHVCDTCQKLDVASSADRVRFLLAGMAKKSA